MRKFSKGFLLGLPIMLIFWALIIHAVRLVMK